MRRTWLASVAWLVVAGSLGAQSKKGDLLVALKFLPQESFRGSSVALPGSMIDRPVDIKVEDSRQQPDPRIIGQGTDDDDLVFPIRATADVVPFVSDAVSQMAAAWNLKKSAAPERLLQVRLSRFDVQESNKAMGSTYSAEVHLAFSLRTVAGDVLVEGAASGTANRYGRARSGANAAEVLSDALKEAFTGTLADQKLQAAWMSGQASPGGNAAPAGPRGTVEERLQRLEDLRKRGIISEDEYKTQRAEILKQL